MAFLNQYDKYGFDKSGYNRAGFDRMGYNREGFDRQGFNKQGFNKDGINKLTGRDIDGYDAHGYDEAGYDRAGFDKEGYSRDGFNKDGYDRAGYNLEGYNEDGLDRDGFNKSGFDVQGYDRNGYNTVGYNRDGFNRAGFDRNGYDKSGFNKNGFNREGYDKAGFNKNGIDKDGYNREGFNSDGYNRDGRDICGFNKDGVDEKGYSVSGWTSNGFNILGYGKDGFNSEGYSIDGYKRDQFDSDGYHLLTGFNLQGYDREGFNINDIDANGYTRDGFNSITGYNRLGYDQNGYNKEGYNAEGFDSEGYDKTGFDKAGYNRAGYNRNGFNRDGFNQAGYDERGYNADGYNEYGEYDPEKEKIERNLLLNGSNDEDEKKERDYLTRCIQQVRIEKDSEFRERKARDYPSKTLYRYHDCELQETITVQPDTSQLERNIYGRYADRLNCPYVAEIRYAGISGLYFGREKINGYVTVWTDPRAKYWYTYQAYIGDENVDLSLVRNFVIKGGKLIDFTDEYNKEDTFATIDELKLRANRIADERLRKIIELNRESKQTHDIIASIQKNQYEIIASEPTQSIVVNGCAGSGKSMILMHRIRYIKNNNDVDLNDCIVVSPTNILQQETKQLSNILQVSETHQYTAGQFYLRCFETYFNRGNFFFEHLTVDETNLVDATHYQEEYLKELVDRLGRLCKPGKEKEEYQKYEAQKLNILLNKYLSTLQIGRAEFFKSILKYREARKEVCQYDRQTLEQFIENCRKKTASLEQKQTAVAFFDCLIENDVFANDAVNRIRSDKDVEQAVFYTCNSLERLDIDRWNYAIQKEKGKLHTVKDYIMAMQIYLTEPLDLVRMRKVIQELTRLSETDAIKCRDFMQKEVERLYSISYKTLAVNNAIKKKYCGEKNSERLPDSAFDLLGELYQKFADSLEQNDYELFAFFDLCDIALKRLESLSQDKKEKNGNSYLFYKALHIVGISEETSMVSVEQMFELLFLVNSRLNALDKKAKNLYIDEFQDFSPVELQLIGKIYPAATFDMFGDLNQCINDKGIRKIEDIPSIKEWKHYQINENYRNAKEITEYVNHITNLKMRPVGLAGVQKCVNEFTHLKIEQDDRIAIIVENESTVENAVRVAYDSAEINFYSESKQIQREKYNVISLNEVKGLEFEKVIVVKSSMDMNQFYVACTRAISELYVLAEVKGGSFAETSCMSNSTHVPEIALFDELTKLDIMKVPLDLRDGARKICVKNNDAQKENFFLVPFEGKLKTYTRNVMVAGFIPQTLNERAKVISVTVDEQSHIIYITNSAFKKYKEGLTMSEYIELRNSSSE